MPGLKTKLDLRTSPNQFSYRPLLQMVLTILFYSSSRNCFRTSCNKAEPHEICPKKIPVRCIIVESQ